MIHIEDLTLIERERLHDVMEGVGVHRFLERLTQQILPRFGVGDVFENRQNEVVAHQAFRCAEESQVAHDDEALVAGEPVGFPKLDVALHRHFGWEPVVGAAVEVMFPGPFVFERHELVHIDGPAVQQAFIRRVDPTGEIVRAGRFV